jgi:hypothetical protein
MDFWYSKNKIESNKGLSFTLREDKNINQIVISNNFKVNTSTFFNLFGDKFFIILTDNYIVEERKNFLTFFIQNFG